MITLDLSNVPGLYPSIALVPKGNKDKALSTLLVLNKEIELLFKEDQKNRYKQAILN